MYRFTSPNLGTTNKFQEVLLNISDFRRLNGPNKVSYSLKKKKKKRKKNKMKENKIKRGKKKKKKKLKK